MQHNAADELHRIWTHPQHPVRCLPDGRERLRQQIVQRLAGLKPLAELARLGLQRLVVQLAVGLFQRQNLVHNRLNLLELPIRVGAEQFVEKSHEVGPLPFVY